MRLVDADELIALWSGISTEATVKPDSVIDTIKKAPIVPTFGQWIDVKDKLPNPEDEDTVIIFTDEIETYGRHKEKKKMYHGVYKGYFDGSEWYTQWCYGCKLVKDTNVLKLMAEYAMWGARRFFE